MLLDLQAWQVLAQPECAPLLQALQGLRSEPTPATLERLRRQWDPAVVAAAVELQLARTRGADKFGAQTAELWADREGLQMASAPGAAAWKARRFAGAQRVFDLCCGIGGDLMELARVAPAVGVDATPARAWMAARNAGAHTECRDVLGMAQEVAGGLVHADPGRRGTAGGAHEHRRIVHGADLLPPLADLRRTCARAYGAGIKLGPGMDLAPGEQDAHDELEFICERGVLTQQVLWSGSLAHHAGMRTASVVDLNLTLSGMPAPTPCTGDGAWRAQLALPNPALERARLVHRVAGTAAEPALGLGILTADQVPESPWLERHEVLAQLPARPRAVAPWLRAHDAGTPVVRTRGKACQPEEWQQALRAPSGPGEHVVWVLRVGSTRTALITRPLGSTPSGR